MINRFKTYVKYDTLDELFRRQDAIIDTTKKALERESNENYKYTFIDSQIVATIDNKYVLELRIEKNNI